MRDADIDDGVTRLFGFLLGTVLAGGGLYYYVVDEYKVSNELLVEDIYVSDIQYKRAHCEKGKFS